MVGLKESTKGEGRGGQEATRQQGHLYRGEIWGLQVTRGHTETKKARSRHHTIQFSPYVTGWVRGGRGGKGGWGQLLNPI